MGEFGAMAGSIELSRACLEEVERLENVIVKDLDLIPNGHKERLQQQHRVKAVLSRIVTNAKAVTDSFSDEDGARREELASMSGANVFSRYYERLKEMKDYHRRFPEHTEISFAADGKEVTFEDQILKQEIEVEFSGEEGQGRFVDFHTIFGDFINLKLLDGEPMDYTQFLDQVSHLSDLPPTRMMKREYQQWVQQLYEYLVSFQRRIRPLQDVEKILVKSGEEFAQAWAVRVKPGGGALLEGCQSAADVEALGADTIKAELATLGLKCGGAPQDRAERLWATKGVDLSTLDPSFFPKAKAKAKAKSAKAQAGAVDTDPERVVAECEFKVTKLMELLADTIDATKLQIEKKQGRTYEEIAEEQEAMEEEAYESEESDAEDAPIYNPLNLPLGWDGKPIPFWLYKLHGLNIEYKCEICGNYSYWGPRAFDRHFQEWRHAHGMRCLGIPNSREFHGITKIQDAIDLWLKIKKRNKDTHFNENDEEFEDSAGNVMSKRTYEDLKKQGLLGDF